MCQESCLDPRASHTASVFVFSTGLLFPVLDTTDEVGAGILARD